MLVVLDTNVVLDLLVFRDGASGGLRDALASGHVQWIATAPMRGELARVLDYPQVRRQLAARGGEAADVLRAFDAAAVLQPVPPSAPVQCADADDQGFVDLALVHGALLLSRDREVLRLRTRLAARGIAVAPSLPQECLQPQPVEAA